MSFDENGNLYVANYLSSTITKITPAGVGCLFADAADGLNRPFDVAIGVAASSSSLALADKTKPRGHRAQHGPIAGEAELPVPMAATDIALSDGTINWLAYYRWLDEQEDD